MVKKLEKLAKDKVNLDKEGFPNRAGVYRIENHSFDHETIEVYRHSVKGLCCFKEDFGSAGTEVNDRYDCHVSVQNTGLTFIKRVGNLSGRRTKYQNAQKSS